MPGRLPHGFRAFALLATLLAALVAAGCGSSGTTSSGAGPDPATLAPAGAALYGQVVIRPSGDLRSGAEAALRKVLRTQDGGAALRRLLDKDKSNDVIFSRDVEPWLGQRIGGFLLMPAAGARKPDYAIALALADRGKFEDTLARMRSHGAEHPAGSYRGVSYDQDRRDPTQYEGRVGDFFVMGSLAGIRAAIDTSKGGAQLAADTRFKDAVGGVPGNALAYVYADPKAIAAGAHATSAAGRRAVARYEQAAPVVATLTATGSQIALQATVDKTVAGDLGGSSNAQVSVGQLPGDSWLALATPPLGPLVKQALDTSGAHARAAAQVSRSTGLDLDRDLLDPLGGLGLFVRGSSPLDMGGGVLLQLTEAAAAQRLLTRLQAVVAAGAHLAPRPLALAGARGFQLTIPQSPQPIVVLAQGAKLAAGYAASSAQDLLAPQQRFDASPDGKAAIASLGGGYTPELVLIVPPLARLLRTLDGLQAIHVASALPYLSAYRSLAVGTKRDGDRTSVRVVVALQ